MPGEGREGERVISIERVGKEGVKRRRTAIRPANYFIPIVK